MCGEHTVVVVLQNGVEQVEQVRPLCPDSPVIPGIVWYSATTQPQGWVRLRTEPALVLPSGPSAQAVAALLRDAGCRVVFRDPDVLKQAHRLRAEFCVAVAGLVEIRPEGNANPEIATGDIEVNASSLTVLGESAPLPFQLDEPAGEELRLKYRYLDLRRDAPAA
ncbi:2-dehydropantoate 2-reductase N-terminal domain-containing protein, partial [Mycobacterium avium]|uniref:2-dehydropantoate 2-reductase N-terminal domain-containing protein n=1 Tax=Mycobacterium avium TaxID=1764 RepID=UPI0027D25EAB